MQSGSPVGLSCRPRGQGTIDEEGKIVDFKLISFDLVADQDAFENIKENDYVKPKE